MCLFIAFLTFFALKFISCIFLLRFYRPNRNFSAWSFKVSCFFFIFFELTYI
jgi:hypothetical protein